MYERLNFGLKVVVLAIHSEQANRYSESAKSLDSCDALRKGRAERIPADEALNSNLDIRGFLPLCSRAADQGVGTADARAAKLQL